MGEEVYVYPSGQVDNAGEVVAKAFEKILGEENVSVMAIPHYTSLGYFWEYQNVDIGSLLWGYPSGLNIELPTLKEKFKLDYWVIKAEKKQYDELPKFLRKTIRNLLGAIEDKIVMKVFLQKDDCHGTSLREAYGGGRYFGKNVYIDYMYFDDFDLYCLDDSDMWGKRQALLNFPITLWHELIGHVFLNLGHSIAGMIGKGAEDPTHEEENQARKSWNFNNPTELLKLRNKYRHKENLKVVSKK